MLDGLAGGGEKADAGLIHGSADAPSDFSQETSVEDAPLVPVDLAADPTADAEKNQDARVDGGSAVDPDGRDHEDSEIDVKADADRDAGGVADGANGDASIADANGDASIADAGRDVDGRVLCSCPGDAYCASGECIYTSCRARLAGLPEAPNGVVTIDPDGDGDGGEPPFRAYCEMAADGGGWTLALKVDGTLTTFLHGSALWESSSTYQAEYPDLDLTEAKLASYRNVAFSSVRIGMREDGITRWIVAPVGATSFRDLMRAGYHATTLGRAAWKSLPASGSLQTLCSREGFNVTATQQAGVRIGILGNEYDSCNGCDSWIGFGGELTNGGYACGNVARWDPDNGDRDRPLFGYIMVR